MKPISIVEGCAWFDPESKTLSSMWEDERKQVARGSRVFLSSQDARLPFETLLMLVDNSILMSLSIYSVLFKSNHYNG